jgi:hypothetical protein
MMTAQLLTQCLLAADAQRIRQSRVFINTVLDLTQCVETFKTVVLPMYKIPNHSGQSGFSDWLVLDLVFRVVGDVHLTRRACGVFVHPTL